MTYEVGKTFDKYDNDAAEWARENRATLVFDEERLCYVLVPDALSDEEYARRAGWRLRQQRDELLARTDFLMMPDYPIEPADLEVVRAYREALRNVPQQGGFPMHVQWPDVPSGLERFVVI